MADKTGEFYTKPPKTDFKTILWNPNTRAILGRTKSSWAKILLFYLLFYVALIGFWLALYFVFNTTLPDGHPKYTDIIGTSPGLSVRPRSDEMNFEHSNPRAVINVRSVNKPLVDDIQKLFNGTRFTEAKNLKKVGEINNMSAPCTAENGYGYNTRKPCVFLKLNKIYNWQPEFYESIDDLPDDMPQLLKDHIKNQNDLNTVWVSCEDEKSSEAVNIKQINYFGVGKKQGFPGQDFPFKGNKDYKQPLVAVQFESVASDVVVSVECKAWAKNIVHDRLDAKGTVRFQLLIMSVL